MKLKKVERNLKPEIVIEDENGNLILQLACRHDGCTMNMLTETMLVIMYRCELNNIYVQQCTIQYK